MEEKKEKKEKSRKIKPDLLIIVERLLNKYCYELSYDDNLKTKLVDFILNYIYLILSESNQLAEFKKLENINGNHVNIAISNIMKKINCIEKEDISGIVKLLKVTKNHNLNNEEPIINHKDQENIILDKTKHLYGEFHFKKKKSKKDKKATKKVKFE